MAIDRLEARQNKNSEPEELALLGGRPVRTRQWPKWPRASASTQRNLLDVLHSTKWTLSGQSENADSYERQFAKAFAKYCGTEYAIPCGSGSAALTIALQALGIGPGDDVVLPGLAWVACAASVYNLGANPVPADVDPETLCMTAHTAREALTKHTRAIMAIHLYSTHAPMGELKELTAELNIPLIEDASHAHGALIDGKKSGSYGDISVFSMQQSKLLTAGEGGICLTNDRNLYLQMQQFRADGRIYTDEISDDNIKTDPYGFSEISPRGDVLGRNLCLSEFHASILLDRLNGLDAENEHRRTNFQHLSLLLSPLPGVKLVENSSAEGSTHYRICIKLDENILDNLDIDDVMQALQVELRLPVEGIDLPLDINPLFPVSDFASLSNLSSPKKSALPVAGCLAGQCLTLPHWCLLGDARDAEDIVEALEKVLFRLKHRLPKLTGM